MELSNVAAFQFAKTVNSKTKGKSESTVYGTIVVYGGEKYVKMDGSDLLTPCDSTVSANEGERVTVLVKNHTATVNGNLSSPAARSGDVEDVKQQVLVVEQVVADKADIKDLNVERARIEELVADNAVIKGRVSASEADIGDLQSVNATITGKLDANEAGIKKLDAEKLSSADADITFATIENLNASNAKIKNLDANYGNIKNLLSGAAGIGDLQNIHLTSKNAVLEEALIKNAVIQYVSIGDLQSGTILTSKFTIMDPDGGLLIKGPTAQWSDKDGNVRIQIGQDAQKDFTFTLFDATGKGVLIDSSGIKPDAVPDGLIVDSMVSNNAAISGSKLDISSVASAINDSSSTIKSSRIWLDEQNQSLTQAYDRLDKNITRIDEKAGLGYHLSTSSSIMRKQKDGQTFLPGNVTFSAYKNNNGGISSYSGRYRIEESFDNGATYKETYMSNSKELIKIYTPSDVNVNLIRCTLYDETGEKNLDSQTVMLIADAEGLADDIEKANENTSKAKEAIETTTQRVGRVESDLEGLTVSLSDATSELHGLVGNSLLFNVTYHDNGDETTTLNAEVYQNGKNVTQEYPNVWFEWIRKTESVEKAIGYGYSITVNNSDYLFGGVVVGRFTTYKETSLVLSKRAVVIGGKRLKLLSNIS